MSPTLTDRPDHFSGWSSQSPTVSQNTASRLGSLLDDGAMDLAQISDAIRACPDFERLGLRRSNSLNLSFEPRIVNVEEAAVILGKDRLKVLLETWSHAYENPPAAENEPTTKEKYVALDRSIPEGTDEGNVSQEELAGLLFRDF